MSTKVERPYVMYSAGSLSRPGTHLYSMRCPPVQRAAVGAQAAAGQMKAIDTNIYDYDKFGEAHRAYRPPHKLEPISAFAFLL